MVHDWLHATMANQDQMAYNTLKYLLFSPLQKSFADLGSRPSETTQQMAGLRFLAELFKMPFGRVGSEPLREQSL